MMKKIFLFTSACLCALSVFSQQSPLLEKYRAMALDYNHDVKAAEKNITASLELEKTVRADRKPKVAAGANFQYTGNPMELSLPTQSTPLSFQGKNAGYGASVSLLQPIYTGGRIMETIKRAQHEQSFAFNQSDMIKSSVCLQTDVQYWNTVARNELIGITTDFRDAISSLVKIVCERVDVGLADPNDLLMAEVKLNEADYQLMLAQNNFETGRMALNSIIGVGLNLPTEVESAVPIAGLTDSLKTSKGNKRPEISMATDQLKMQKSTLKLNDAGYRPQFYIGADGSYSSPGYNFDPDLDPNYSVYAKLSIPVFEWGKRRSEKRRSTEKIGIATDQLHKVEDQVNLETETARIALEQALNQVKLTENSLGKARENERRAMERYAEGEISILEVIDAQIYRQTSQVYHVQSKVAAQSYLSELKKALNLYDY